MERKANFVLIGLFTLAVIAGAFGFVFWIHQTAGKKQSVAYRVIFDGSVSGLRVGSSVLFNGIRVGEVTQLALNVEKPTQVVAMLQVNKATPIRSDTRVGLEFAGLTGIASVSLRGISATTTLLEKEEGEPPTLKADPNAGQDVMGAAREVLSKAMDVITENQEELHKAIVNVGVFTDSLARNAKDIDEIVANTKHATASASELADNLDKRTAEITVGVNRLTATATRQIEIVGKSIVDLTHNPQRFLFGGGGGGGAAGGGGGPSGGSGSTSGSTNDGSNSNASAATAPSGLGALFGTTAPAAKPKQAAKPKPVAPAGAQR
jgi:phospholipid/cholesterol/gamma-HCH transport system substrate-binding protein